MSKESAMSLATGTPTPAPTNVTTPAGEPGLVAAPPVTATPPAPTELESTRFAHLSKKEAQLVRDREAYKKETEAFNVEREKIKAITQKAQAFEELRAKGDSVAALKAIGFTDTDIMNLYAANEDTSTPEEKAARAAQAEIQKFQDQMAKREAEAQAKANEAALTEFRTSINAHLASDKDKYEYCNFYAAEAESLIEETVSTIYNDSKELISVAEAAAMVEQFYEDRDRSMNTIKKRTPKPAADAPAPSTNPLKAEVSPRPSTPSKTLSSRTVATVASTTVPRKESPADKRERLIEKLRTLGK